MIAVGKEAAGLPSPPLVGPVLITGATGMLGRSWMRLLSAHHVDHVATDRTRFDLSKPELVDLVVEPSFRYVINCAAWTDVDGAEDDTLGADIANGTTVARLAKRCAQTGAMLIHYSSDYVFNGEATQPYTVDQPRDPLNAYGRSKAIGEEAIERSGCRHLIIRTSWVYAPWGKNFVRTMAKLVREKPVVKVVNDQRGRPTSAEHLAVASARLIAAGASGIFHVTDSGECTWFDFACEIARLVGSECQVTPCTTDEFPRPAKRPSYSVLDLTRTERVLGPLPDWKENLADVMGRLE